MLNHHYDELIFADFGSNCGNELKGPTIMFVYQCSTSASSNCPGSIDAASTSIPSANTHDLLREPLQVISSAAATISYSQPSACHSPKISRCFDTNLQTQLCFLPFGLRPCERAAPTAPASPPAYPAWPGPPASEPIDPPHRCRTSVRHRGRVLSSRTQYIISRPHWKTFKATFTFSPSRRGSRWKPRHLLDV